MKKSSESPVSAKEFPIRALLATPGSPTSARLGERESSPGAPAAVKVKTVLLGLCGTDHELLHGTNHAPELIIGHEVVGIVQESSSPEITTGSFVVGIIRRPCAENCPACAAGELDQCSSGDPRERGILHLDGFGADTWSSDPEYLVGVPASLGEVGVLIEPASSIVKIMRRIGRERLLTFRTAAVYGAGPMGFLAAVLLQDQGLTASLIDPFAGAAKTRIAEQLQIELVAAPSTTAPDLAIELSGTPEGLINALSHSGRNTFVAVMGIYERSASLDPQLLNQMIFTDTELMFSVNASRSDYEEAASMLAAVGPDRLSRLITREVAPHNWTDGLIRDGDEVKTVVRFTQA